MRVRSLAAALVAAAVLTTGAVVAAPAPAGMLPSPVDPTIPDGDPDSLRDVLVNQAVDGDTVELAAGATYVLDDCQEGSILITAAITIHGNGATIEQQCPGERVLEVLNAVEIHDVTITGGTMLSGEGGGIYVDGEAKTVGSLVLVRSSVIGNAANDGGGIGGTGPITIVDSTISGNASADGGGIHFHSAENELRVVRSTITANCAEDDGGAIYVDGTATVVNSTVSGNIFSDGGAVDVAYGSLTLVYSTVVANIHRDEVSCELTVESDASADDEAEVADVVAASNIQVRVDATMTTFGSVIALPIELDEGLAAFNCDLSDGGIVDSVGYNFSDDASCDLTSDSDTQDGPDPQLANLAFNGGPTPTHLPAATSPLVDAIPTEACSAGDGLAGQVITTDQRLLPRPDVVSGRCDIGSVEIQTAPPEPLVPLIEPTFTG